MNILRDKKGRFTSAPTHRLTEDEARKGGKVTTADRVARMFKMFDSKPLTEDEAMRIDSWLLSLSRDEVARIATDKTVPMAAASRALQLLEKKTTFEATEKMYNRLYGMPKQRNETQMLDVPPVIVNVVDTEIKDTNETEQN